MKRPPKMRTPDHTRSNLSREKYYRPFMDGYIKLLQSNLKQVKHIGHNYSYTTYTCGEPHDRQNPNWKPFKILWDYCERNVGWSEMMKSADEWSWKVCLGLILEDREEGDWIWFSLLFGLLYWSGCMCVLRLLISNWISMFQGMD